MWLAERKDRHLPTVNEVDNFCVVDSKLFDEYEAFAATFTRSELFLPSNPVTHDFLKEKSLPMKVTMLYGDCFIDFPEFFVDEFYEWIMNARQRFVSGLGGSSTGMQK